MSADHDPLDDPRPETLETTFRAMRAFAPQVTFVVLVFFAVVLVLSAIGLGDGERTVLARLVILGTSLMSSFLFAMLGYGICVYVLTGERIGGWAAYRRTNPLDLRLFVIVSLLFAVVLAIGDSLLNLLPDPLGGFAVLAFSVYSIFLILRYATVLPAIARGEGIDLVAARGRGQTGALFMRLLIIPFLGFTFLTMIVLTLAALRLPQELILIPSAIGAAIWIVSMYVVLAKAYLGAYK